MALETPVFISDLVAANPPNTDPKSEGAAHLRNLKSALKTTFPAVTGAVVASHTELNFVGGVTSAIQTQIDTKAPSVSPTFTGTVTLPDATSIGTVSAAELLTLDGVTSAIQTQIDARAPNDSPTFTGTVTLPATGAGATSAVRKDYADALSFAAALPAQAGNAGKVVTTNGVTASWIDVTAKVPRTTRSSNTILTSADVSSLFDLSSTFTQTFSAAATLGNGWSVYLRNTGNGTITLDPNSTELIDGAATYSLLPGFSILLTCNGTGLNVLTLKSRTYDHVAEYTASSSLVVPADTYVIRPYALGAGAAGTNAASGGGGGMAYGDIAVVPGQTVTLTISAGVATVVYGGVTMLTANPASGVTAGTASKDASVTNGGAYSGGAGNSTGSNANGGASSGSPLGAGVAGGAGAASFGGSGWGGAGSENGGGGVGGASMAGGTGIGGGKSLDVPSIDPLFFGLNGPIGTGQTIAGVRGGAGGPGAGGGASSASGGPGGFGAGSGPGANNANSPGGFGGGGGGGANSGAPGGFGGGGGRSASTPGAGGPAVIRIYY